eukprot:2912380-Rhodomonas_salina.1
MQCTELAYAPMRRAVLSQRMLLCVAQYESNICCYATRGTERAYAARRMGVLSLRMLLCVARY